MKQEGREKLSLTKYSLNVSNGVAGRIVSSLFISIIYLYWQGRVKDYEGF